MGDHFYKYLIGFLILIGLINFAPSCHKKDNYNINVEETTVMASDNLDLQAVGVLVKEAKDAEHLERLINDKSRGVNNLDLNEDDKVDYIKVTEYGEENIRGFSLTVEVASGEEQEVAVVEIEKTSDQANVQIHGNEQMYGQNHYHRSSFGVTDFLLMSYLFSSHRYYASPWRYGYYPSYYSAYRPVPHRSYRQNVAPMTKSTSYSKTNNSSIKNSVKSPNATKSASSIKAPLRKPTSTQKSFQSRNPSKQIKSGGFGSKRPSRPSVRSSSSSRSGRSFSGK